MKKILEELSSSLAKEKWRKLVKKYHPDASKADNEIIRKINDAKDKGDISLLSLYKELTGEKVDIPLTIEQLQQLQDTWAKDIEQKKSEKYWIYEIYPNLLKDGSIKITIRFRWDGHYVIVIKDGEKYKTKDVFIKAIRERIEKRVELQKRKYNKEAGEDIYTLKKKQQKRRKKAKLKDLKMPERF